MQVVLVNYRTRLDDCRKRWAHIDFIKTKSWMKMCDTTAVFEEKMQKNKRELKSHGLV